MRIAYTPEQEQLRRELREYFGRLMTDEVRAAIDDGAEGDYGNGDAYRAVVERGAHLVRHQPAEVLAQLPPQPFLLGGVGDAHQDSVKLERVLRS